MQYDKKHTTFDEQITKLEERGLVVKDRDRARHYLETIGYYRLSSYWFVLESKVTLGKRSHIFECGASFDDAVRLYVFDQRLRSLVLEALERFEISARASWSHLLSEKGGAHAHMDASFFKNYSEYCKSYVLLIDDVARAQKTSSEVCHYQETYSEPESPPIWIVVSCMSFGELFRWIQNTKENSIKLGVARAMGVPNIDIFESIARNLTTIRNICAHHARLWDRKFITRMPCIKEKHLKAPMVTSTRKEEKNGKIHNIVEADNRMYNYLLILAHLMLELSPKSTWAKRIRELIAKDLTVKEQTIMGFPSNWQSLEIWKN